MPVSAILACTGAETDPGAAQEVLAEVSRLVAFRYDLPETFDSLLLRLRSTLHVDLLSPARPEELDRIMRMRYSLSTDAIRAGMQ